MEEKGTLMSYNPNTWNYDRPDSRWERMPWQIRWIALPLLGLVWFYPAIHIIFTKVF